LSGEELGAVEAEGFYSNEDLAWLWGGNRTGFEFEDLGTTCEFGLVYRLSETRETYEKS
jgi:hypothetical protein